MVAKSHEPSSIQAVIAIELTLINSESLSKEPPGRQALPAATDPAGEFRPRGRGGAGIGASGAPGGSWPNGTGPLGLKGSFIDSDLGPNLTRALNGFLVWS